jgi:serine/threonine-protein kinase
VYRIRANIGALQREPAGSVPRRIGRYEIERLEAEGGMGEVFLARDPLMKRNVAVKLLKRVLCDDPDTRHRFIKEAEAIAGLEHPAIVPVYDFGEHDEQLYFVMRYVSGGTLKQRLEHYGTMPLRDVARVIERVAEALEAAHARNLVHRDIKPANILFDTDGVAYLSDFGIVKHEKAVDQTDTGSLLLGTPQYLSPEQAMGQPLDARSDVYSLGVVAYHAIAGEPPFVGKTPMAVAMGHVMQEPPPIRQRVPGLASVTDDVFARVLAKDPEQRYPSARAFAKDLADIASGRWYIVKIASKARTREVPQAQPRARSRRTGDTGEFFAAGRPFDTPPSRRKPKKG